MKRVIVSVLVAVLFFAVGLGGGVYWGKQEIARIAAANGKNFDELRQRLDGEQRRVADERVRADQMQRLKYELERDQESLNEELVSVSRQKESAIGSSRQEVEKLQRQIAELTEKAALENVKNDQLQSSYQQLQQQLVRFDQEQKTAQTEKEALQSHLKVVGQQQERCLAHNAEMARVASEVLNAYGDKGVFSALLEKEPLTGIKKVEVEHLIQDYRRDISKNSLHGTGG